MVFGLSPECVNCKITESSIWKKNECGDVLCHDCFKANLSKEHESNTDKEKECTTLDIENEEKKDEATFLLSKNVKDDEDENDKEKESCKSTDKKDSKRKTRKGRQGGKGSIPKGKGRRFIFKKSVRIFSFL